VSISAWLEVYALILERAGYLRVGLVRTAALATPFWRLALPSYENSREWVFDPGWWLSLFLWGFSRRKSEVAAEGDPLEPLRR